MPKETTTAAIRTAIADVIDPGNNKTLTQNKAIKHIGIDSEKDLVILIVVLRKCGGDEEKQVKRELAQIIKRDLNFSGIKIQFEEKRIIESIVRQNVRFILIESGKGGVGKSTVAANLAFALKRQGKKTGIIDADIYGSGIPRIIGTEHVYPHADENGKIMPIITDGLELISTEFFTEPERPVIWRGAMLNSMMDNFFYEVSWSHDLEYMIIDCPPGTGDITLDLRTIVPNAQSIIVTTPHPAASGVAVKAGYASLKLNHRLIGVIENMSYYPNPASGEKDFIFGSGGGREVAEKLNTELLAQIPIGQPKHHIGIYQSDEEIGEIYDDLATLLIFNNDLDN